MQPISNAEVRFSLGDFPQSYFYLFFLQIVGLSPNLLKAIDSSVNESFLLENIKRYNKQYNIL